MSGVKPSRSRRGEKAWLAGYRPEEFPPFAVTVDLCIFTVRESRLCALLVRRADHPYRHFWALPGGHIRHGTESAADAARRELGEETGVAWAPHRHLEQLATYSEPDRDPRMGAGLQVVSVAFVALAADLPEPVAATDAMAACWWPVEALDLEGQARSRHGRAEYRGPAVPLAFDHAVMLSDALERVRAKLEYSTLATGFVREPFSLADLRLVYAAVWGFQPDPANFRRKVLSVPGFLEPLPAPSKRPGPAGGRPAVLYRAGPAVAIAPPFLRDPAG